MLQTIIQSPSISSIVPPSLLFSSLSDNLFCGENKKYIDDDKINQLKKKIFPYTSNDNIKKLMIDKESLHYITFSSDATNITKIICDNLINFPAIVNYKSEDWQKNAPEKKMKQLVITDMTAGVGGNVYNFSKFFKYVNAIELNTNVYNCLKNNIEVYKLNNINCYNDDSVKLLIENDDIGQDIIFFDPPWGGRDYKLHTDIRLKFGNTSTELSMSIENITNILLKRSTNKMIVLKLPDNYDYKYFVDELNMYTIERYQLNRFTILVVKNY